MKATTKEALAPKANFQLKLEFILDASPQTVYDNFFNHPNSLQKWSDAAGCISIQWPEDCIDPCIIGTVLYQDVDSATVHKQVLQWFSPNEDERMSGVIEFTFLSMNPKSVSIQVANSAVDYYTLEYTDDGKTKFITEKFMDLTFFGRTLAGMIRSNNQKKLDLAGAKL